MHKYAFDEYAEYAYFGAMKLHDYLLSEGITDEAFGRQIGCSQSQVSRIKRGKSKPSLRLMERISVVTSGVVLANDFMSDMCRQPEPAE